MTEIVTVDVEDTQLIPKQPTGFLSLEPAQMIAQALEVSRILKDTLNTNVELYDVINGKNYPKVETWKALALLLGYLPKERYVKEDSNGGFEACVDLVRQADGKIIEGFTAICRRDEPTWSKRTDAQRRSMAVTRSAGKSCKMAFGWVMSLAGCEPTPAEEIDEPRANPKEDPRQTQARPVYYTGTEDQKKTLNKVFSELGITDKPAKTVAHDHIVEAGNIEADGPHLLQAVKTLKEGKII